ncbi:MAG TPA: hypothetical protein P5036_03530 [Albidovulum sp.]|uniref:hypothetical protein n=1 Tax=Albidovulum sp. TaxID=1872424 RepID=UPI001DBDEB03|nr:hypothetical protein [Paracoccaceae bacterium]MCP5324632.1 hypothetical protein [Paracoccaceae bacterium]MCP5354673.1 hypothetical protein [Paracoccaceae bacterium]HPE25144.1 hypothetical protein [Albidovulum sp.]HRV62028.1 hypothetical protein [Albidovulum sp.]
MTGASVIFSPLLPWPAIWVAAALALAFVALALWRGLSGWWLRALAAAALIGALTQPALQREDRRPLSDIVILVVDRSASQSLPGRPEQTAAAVARVSAEVAALPETELRVVELGDGPDDTGTRAMTALAQALAEEPRARVAGAILITDGQVHDMEAAPALPAPLNVLMTGRDRDWDRRVAILSAPAFGIIGEEAAIRLRVEDQGQVPPAEAGGFAQLSVTVDGGESQAVVVPVNTDIEVPLRLDHGGTNVVQFAVATAEGELTDRNNMAVVEINGVRDRLRVLLVSGEPHAGERTWRNLLKSDSAVDLVHFTILRPPEKQDGVPVSELSLIAFPTRELFVEKINEFDLIIFDRYKLRGILPASYFSNIRDYVLQGGAVLVSAGPDFASAESIFYSSLAEILPAAPTGRVIDGGFKPALTALGHRHPVTEGLEAFAPGAAEGGESPGWGSWLRIVDLEKPDGQVVMQGPDARPLLVLNRVGEGRIALLASDQAWLWSRGYEGGGPQLELLRRLAHWMMKEPELEEEALLAEAKGTDLTITRRSLAEGPRDVTLTGPDGAVSVVPLAETEPGRFTATWAAPGMGLYRLSDGDLTRVVALGPATPKEFEETIATDERLAPAVEPTNGGFLRLEDGLPDLRQVRAGRPAVGRGWIGITPRDAYVTQDIRILPLLPAWLLLLLTAGLAVAAWLREGRR